MILSHIEEVLLSIKNKLLATDELKRLVHYTTPDALGNAVPSIEDVETKFITYPLITEDNKIPCFVAINYDGTVPDWVVKKTSNVIKISCVCHRNLWELDNNHIRAVVMSEIVSELVQNQEFGSVGKLNLTAIVPVYYTPEIIGFALVYEYVDSLGNEMPEF